MQSARLEIAPQQTQTASLRLQRAVKLLQMSSQDFLHSITDTLQENPFLDGDEGEEGELPGPLSALTAEAAIDAPAGDAPAEDPADGGADDRGDDRGDDPLPDTAVAGEDWGQGATSESSTMTALDLSEATVTLAAHLHAQLALMRLAPRDLALAKMVVELLDDDGYLRSDPAETLALMDGESDLDAGGADVERAVRRVQSLDPPGIGARSVQECLQIQCGQIECLQLRTRALVIVTAHLQRLAQNDVAWIAHVLGCSEAEVEAACAAIRRFDPRPGWRHGGAAAHYVTPDVVVQRHRNRWRVLLNPAVVPRVRMNRQVVDLFRQDRARRTDSHAPQHRGLTSHLQEARWVLRNVEQRFCTIVAVAQAIVDRQGLFLEHGELAMKPLALAEVAAVVGVHESTVSRVTSNKYITTPVGTFELKHFFSRAFVMPSGTAYSAIAIRRLVREMIEAEPAGRPLSDAEVAGRLKQQGFPLARRTVTKYRQEMRIAPAGQRRPLAAA